MVSGKYSYAEFAWFYAIPGSEWYADMTGYWRIFHLHNAK